MPGAVVVGAGVAGPATALLLRRAGWEVELLEADPDVRPSDGLFLNVATNGLAVLGALGLRDRLLTDAHACPRMVVRNGSGRRLGEVPNGPAGEPERGSVVVRRAWLHRVLRDGAAAEGVPIATGLRVVGIDETADRVRVTGADGRTVEADVLVGCDGLRSTTRTWVDPDAPGPRYTGLVGLGGFARVDGLAPTPGEQHFVFGARSFFGYLVRGDGTAYWFANVTAPEPARDSGDDRAEPRTSWSETLRALHADDPYPVPQLLAATVGEPVAYPVHELPPVPHWHRSRVVLAGDAAHATSPSIGQGASMALEDAAVLARSLAEEPSYHEAFARYEHLRRPRAERVAAYARSVDARKRVPGSRFGVAVRDALMPLFLRAAARDTRNRWLYDEAIGADARRRTTSATTTCVRPVKRT